MQIRGNDDVGGIVDYVWVYSEYHDHALGILGMNCRRGRKEGLFGAGAGALGGCGASGDALQPHGNPLRAGLAGEIVIREPFQ